MLAYTVISAFALVIMILTFLYFVIKFVDFPIDQFKKLFVKKKHDNKSLDDNVPNEKTVKNKIKRAESRRRNRINYLRSFKRGKGLIFYFIAIPLLFIGILYSGSSPILAITTTIARVIDLLVLKYKADAHNDVVKKLKSLKKFKIRSKSIFKDEVELSLEVDIKENNKKLSNIETTIVDQFNNVDGVINASLIAYQNDFGD